MKSKMDQFTYSKTLLFSSSFHMSGAGPIRTWLPVKPWRPGHISLAVVTPWSFRHISPIHWNGRLDVEKTRKATKLTIPLPEKNVKMVTFSSQHFHPFSMFCVFRPAEVVIAEDGIAVRDERKRQSRRIGKLGKGRGWTPWETCTSVRGILCELVPLQDWVAFWTLCRFVGKQVLAFKRWREQDTASSSRRLRVMGLTKASFGTTKARDVGNLQFPPICAVAIVSKLSWGLVTALF